MDSRLSLASKSLRVAILRIFDRGFFERRFTCVPPLVVEQQEYGRAPDELHFEPHCLTLGQIHVDSRANGIIARNSIATSSANSDGLRSCVVKSTPRTSEKATRQTLSLVL